MCLFVLFTLWQMYQVDREIWVHPMNVERSRKGEYYTLYKDQRNFEDRFFENYPGRFSNLIIYCDWSHH